MFIETFGAFFLPGQTFTKKISSINAVFMLILIIVIFWYGYLSG